ncbi:hypothetical protein I553_10180 [Mycobacterium xenopi 4042]|uniref:NusB/RsmB/TIM44 domain-containing protein n=1 Tax=Mycobacterium xenopi 4042 TaxID=1299334 RepID=X8DEI3_MYCXE|nr:hypothetical protein I553_10180 [Mycobacterium xenopi 4042]
MAEARAALAETNPEVAPVHPYTTAVARGVTEHAAHIDELIASHLQGWTLDRLPAVDRAILRVAVWDCCTPTTCRSGRRRRGGSAGQGAVHRRVAGFVNGVLARSCW